RISARRAATLVATGDYGGYIATPEGLNPHKLAEHVAATGSVVDYRGGKAITREEFFAMESDVFVPAALELELGTAEAKALKAKVVVEGANGPTYPEAEQILADRGIDLIPDVVANSRGVIVWYHRWLQDKRPQRSDVEEVEARLERRMKRTYAQVHDFAEERKVDWRTASYAIGLERVQNAYLERGIFP